MENNVEVTHTNWIWSHTQIMENTEGNDVFDYVAFTTLLPHSQENASPGYMQHIQSKTSVAKYGSFEGI